MSNDTSLAGKVALITGGNTGIGYVTARELLRLGAEVWIACRTPERSAAASAKLSGETGKLVRSLPLDLSDFASVRRCAAQFLETGSALHLLINNAGVAGLRGLSKDGFELTFGTNHLGHFLLTQLLLERIKQSAPARIVTVASKAHMQAKGIDFDKVRSMTSFTGFPEYQVSKLANVLFSAELGRRLANTGVTTYALHPGVVSTEIWRQVPRFLQPLMRLGMITPEQGARTSLYCATAPELARESGLYYDDCQQKTPSKVAQDLGLASELWQRSSQWCQQPASARSPARVDQLP